jgi:hypothetical protein
MQFTRTLLRTSSSARIREMMTPALAALAGEVGGVLRRWCRGRLYDAPALLRHVAGGGAGAVEGAVEVHGQRVVPLGIGDFPELLALRYGIADAGVAEHDVDAPKLIDAALD